MFGKKKISGGKQNGKDVSNISFAYDIPEEDIERSSDWGAPNYDNAQNYITQKRFNIAIEKLHLALYAILALLLLTCVVVTLLLVFGTHYEIAYVDDGTTMMCRVD